MKRIFEKMIPILLLALGCSCHFMPAHSPVELHSPDGQLKLVFEIMDGRAYYQLSADNVLLLQSSRLGFEFQHQPALSDSFQIMSVKKREFQESWQPVWGENSTIKNHYHEMRVQLGQRHQPDRKLEVVFRLFNDGLGFRYVIPKQAGADSLIITDEKTEFNLADNFQAWWQPANYDSYEMLYQHTPVEAIDAVNTPITLGTADGYVLSLHEANLTDYAGMTLKRTDGTILECDLVRWPDGAKVKTTLPMQTPWRTIQVGRTAGDLIASNLIVNLNEPNQLEDTSWIKPMKYIGIWWGMHLNKETWHQGPNHGATTENALRHIDFAAAHGFGGVLVEGWNVGWKDWRSFDYVTPYPDYDLERVAAYAREKGVMIIGHQETGADAAGYEKNMEKAFAQFQRLGIQAIKSGYVGNITPAGQHHHGQWMVQHYRKVVETAAKYQIMVDVHEPIKPTGIRRTWPNMMTREGVRGMEYNAWSDGNPPDHTTILPFTRGLAGPTDYTPGIFALDLNPWRPLNRVHTTLAKQLALAVVLYSPLQMAADLPENYENHPMFEFYEKVPTDWSESKVLNGKIGDFVTITRKNGDFWYLGSITDEEAREFEIPLDFLDEGVKYVAQIFADAADAHWETHPQAYKIGRVLVDASDILRVRLAAGGGQAIEFRPATTSDIKKTPEYQD